MQITIKKLLIFFLFWVFSLLSVAFLSFYLIPLIQIDGQRSFYQSLSNWDGEHFLTIAGEGYTKGLQYAFFPLYPVLIKMVSFLGIGLANSGLILSLIFSFLSLILFWRLLKLDFDNQTIWQAIILLFVFPTSFYFLLIYSESLFLLLTLATFFFARLSQINSKGQNKLMRFFIEYGYILATIFALLSSLSRIVGLATILALWTESYFDKSNNRFKQIVVLAPLGIVCYSLYLYLSFGDPFYFINSEKNWGRFITFPMYHFLENIVYVLSYQWNATTIIALLDLVSAVFGLGLALRGYRFLRKSYFVYALSSILIPLSTTSLGSMPRFLIVIFPLFIVLSLIKNSLIKLILSFIFTLLMGIFIMLYIHRMWIS